MWIFFEIFNHNMYLMWSLSVSQYDIPSSEKMVAIALKLLNVDNNYLRVIIIFFSAMQLSLQ